MMRGKEQWLASLASTCMCAVAGGHSMNIVRSEKKFAPTISVGTISLTSVPHSDRISGASALSTTEFYDQDQNRHVRT